MTSKLVTITGFVQGVGFRGFVMKAATAAGIAGEVWNASDGSVGAIFQHESGEVVDTLIDGLWRGPGRVLYIESRDVDAIDYGTFRIGLSR